MNEKLDVLTPYVNTDVKIPKSVLDALTLHEFSCAARNVATVTPESVRQFLSTRFDDSMASKFKPEYLIKVSAA